MTRASIAGWSLASGFLLLAVVFGLRAFDRPSTPDTTSAAMRAMMAPSSDVSVGASPGASANAGSAVAETGGLHPGLLHGRVTTVDGVVYEGRLRFGGDEEALWSHYFNGFRADNPWKAEVPEDALTERRPIEVLGIRLGAVTQDLDLGRPFMVRFGDIARMDAERRVLEVTLRSGAVARLDRYAADDFADGVRVWDAEHGEVTLGEWRVRSIEFMPAPPRTPATATVHGTAPLHGTVYTRGGEFTGLIQWDREEALVSDALQGRNESGVEVALPFATVASVARGKGEDIEVTLRDGSVLALAYSSDGGLPHRGIYVDDTRYGRVLVSWNAFDRVHFSRGHDGAVATAPGYTDFSESRPLRGTVTTRSGERLEGRLVYDLDETETVHTLDAPRDGVDYTIPFRLVTSIVPAGTADDDTDGMATVTLRTGEVLRLQATGDLGAGHAGVLLTANSDRSSAWVPWEDVARIDFESVDPSVSELAPAAFRR